MTTDQCRSDDEIHKLALGMLSEAEAAAALTHIDSCPKCETRLIAAERNPNPIFTSLRHGMPPASAKKKVASTDRSQNWENRLILWLSIVVVIGILAAIPFFPRRKIPDEQVILVMGHMLMANPGFDGVFDFNTGSDGKAIRLEFASDAVTNLAPLRRLDRPIELQIAARKPGGKLTDITPLDVHFTRSHEVVGALVKNADLGQKGGVEDDDSCCMDEPNATPARSEDCSL